MRYIPSLGTEGWLKDPESVADELLSSFLTTNTSQSTLFRQHNKSLQYILQEFSGDMLGLETELHKVLTSKLTSVFGDSASIIIEVESDEAKPDQFSIKFNSTVNVKGREYVIGKLVNFANSKVLQITNINNG